MASCKPKHCSGYVLLINYILGNEAVLDYKFIYFIDYWKHKRMSHLNITLCLISKDWPIITHWTKPFVLRATLNMNTHYVAEIQFGQVVHIFTDAF